MRAAASTSHNERAESTLRSTLRKAQCRQTWRSGGLPDGILLQSEASSLLLTSSARECMPDPRRPNHLAPFPNGRQNSGHDLFTFEQPPGQSQPDAAAAPPRESSLTRRFRRAAHEDAAVQSAREWHRCCRPQLEIRSCTPMASLRLSSALDRRRRSDGGAPIRLRLYNCSCSDSLLQVRASPLTTEEPCEERRPGERGGGGCGGLTGHEGDADAGDHFDVVRPQPLCTAGRPRGSHVMRRWGVHQSRVWDGGPCPLLPRRQGFTAGVVCGSLMTGTTPVALLSSDFNPRDVA